MNSRDCSIKQLAFNPMKPHVLYASFRRHGAIYGWDLRGDTSVPVQIFRPNGADARPSTNQRIKFDVDLSGKWMSVGDQVCASIDLRQCDMISHGETAWGCLFL